MMKSALSFFLKNKHKTKAHNQNELIQQGRNFLRNIKYYK